jgi:hypothetical protein
MPHLVIDGFLGCELYVVLFIALHCTIGSRSAGSTISTGYAQWIRGANCSP